MPVPALLNQPPAWAYPGARYDLDFANNRYWGIYLGLGSGNGTSQRMKSVGVESNAGGVANSYYRPDPSGAWMPNTAQFAPPVTGYGLWSEGYGVCTNYALWSRDFTNAAWSATNATVTKNQIGADRAFTAAKSAGGSNYVVGDLITLTGGTFTKPAVLQVKTLTGSAVNTVAVMDPGIYSITPTNPVSQGSTSGIGSSATFNLTPNACSIVATANNATVLQTITQNNSVFSAAPHGGSGTLYAVGNNLTAVGGTFTTAAVLKVATVSGGVPTSYTVQTPGSYSVLPSNPVSTTGGAGSGATIDLSFFTFTPSFLLKRTTGSGTISITLDGSNYTDITSLLNTSSLVQVTAPGSKLLASYTLGIKLGTSGDAIVADFAQLENNPFATSPIWTTSASLARGTEGLFINNTPLAQGVADNDGYRLLHDIDYGTPCSVLIQYSGNFDPTLSHLIFGDDVSNIFVSGGAGGGVVTVSGGGGNYTSADSDVSGLFTLNKVAVRWDGSGSSICINGGQITSSSSVKFQPSNLGLTHGGMLNNGANILPTNGFCKRASFWRKALTDGEMKLLTSASTP